VDVREPAAVFASEPFREPELPTVLFRGRG